MENLIESGSSLGTFRSCRKLWEFKYQKMLKPKGYSSALQFGTLTHWLVEQFNKHGRYDPLTYNKFVTRNADQGWSAENLKDYHLDANTAERIVPIWHAYWSKHDGDLGQKSLEFKSVEGEWAYRIAENYIHVGKRDGHFIHTSYQKPFLYELKTASASSDEGYVTRLALDHQISSNVIALQSEDVRVAGTLYDVIYKHALRQKKDESTTAFLERIRADYEAHAAQYFQRLLVPRTPKHLKAYVEELKSTYDDIASGVIYRNTSHCMQFNRLCSFWQVCMDEETPELLALFDKKSGKFEELEKANHL